MSISSDFLFTSGRGGILISRP